MRQAFLLNLLTLYCGPNPFLCLYYGQVYAMQSFDDDLGKTCELRMMIHNYTHAQVNIANCTQQPTSPQRTFKELRSIQTVGQMDQ